MSATTSDGARHRHPGEPPARLWQAVRSGNRHAWKEYLAPRAEDADPHFRYALERLSVVGLRVIASICLGGTLVWLLLGATLLPETLSTVGGLALAGFSLLGLATLLLSFWPPARSRARWLALAVLALLPMLDLIGSSDVAITAGERWAFFAASIIWMMLVAIAALPIRPLQMAAVGIFFLCVHTAVVLSSGARLWGGGAASIAFVLLVMAIITCIGLTVVVYHQRLAAYRARRAAQSAFDELREAQVRVTVSENAASQSRFAAALSHELNTPLGSLTSAFDTVVHAHEREQAHPEAQEKLRSVWTDAIHSGRESALRLREIIGRMKRLTNLDRAEEQVVDLNELWRDTVTFLSGTLGHEVRIELALNPLPPVRCRPQQVGAVFSNLLRNAADAVRERGQIRVSSELRGEDVVIEVRDDGDGMPEQRVRNLFQPTFHVGATRVSTTNWGLFVCRSIVIEHGGWMEIESEEGVGTTARVVLPSLPLDPSSKT